MLIWIQLLLVLSQLSFGAVARKQEKLIVPTVEIVPNYLFHLFVVGEVWADRRMDYSHYRLSYSKWVRPEDIRFLNEHRQMIAWGNGQSGPLTALMFFLPTRTGKIDSKKDLERFLCLARRSFENKAGIQVFNAAYPELALPERYIESFWQSKGDYQAEFFRCAEILLANYDAYEKHVWPIERRKLRQTANLLRKNFEGSASIEKWEALVQRSFPGRRFEIVLTSANRQAPSANDLAPTRYNFYGTTENLRDLKDLILHEIGANLLAEDRKTISADPLVRKRIEEAGLEPDRIIWRAYESLAEFYKARLFSIGRAEWQGVAFDGEPFHFPAFFETYESEISRDPSQSPLQMMEKGISRFIAWHAKQSKDSGKPDFRSGRRTPGTSAD